MQISTSLRGGLGLQSTSRRSAPSDWVSIGRAAERLGVNPATLRQWTALGKVHAYRTPGGHRRFSASEIASLAAATANAPAGIAVELMDRLRQRYQAAAQTAASHERWITQLDEEARRRFHGLGATLLTHLSEYVTAASPRLRRVALQAGRDIGRQYGELCSAAGLDTARAVDAYVVFRRPLLDVLGQVIAAHPEHSSEMSRVMRDAEAFMDQVLGSIASGAAASNGERAS
jgi:excisionase family DNA binding protein